MVSEIFGTLSERRTPSILGSHFCQRKIYFLVTANNTLLDLGKHRRESTQDFPTEIRWTWRWLNQDVHCFAPNDLLDC